MFSLFVKISSCLVSAYRQCFQGPTMLGGCVAVDVQLVGLFSSGCGWAVFGC